MKHNTYGTKVEYWQLVAARLNNKYGGNFTYQQCKSRFNALVREFYISLNTVASKKKATPHYSVNYKCYYNKIFFYFEVET